jgi:peptidoglycan/xylan/chitin deacetylase (PgdA/CDA1 family)
VKFKIQPPAWLRLLYPGAIWRLNRSKKVVYLTFDDGPTPDVTSWVLDLLYKENVLATFFCLGKNVDEHPGLFQNIVEREHRIGNHSYSHPRSFRTATHIYVADIEKAAGSIQSKLFRPPYGQLGFRSFIKLRKNYSIVFWDVLSEDYNPDCSPEQVIDNVMRYTRPGSLIVFHDSLKAFPRLQIALPEVILRLKAKGYTFGVLPD